MIEKGAIFSKCQLYRYMLWRIWDTDRSDLMIVGLNPSTADAQKDDPTIRRCIQFARDLGFGGVYIANLFAYKATLPSNLFKATDPVGPLNNFFLSEFKNLVSTVLVAWGNHGVFLEQNQRVLKLFENPYCLKINKSGEPAHPLYLKKSETLKHYPLSHDFSTKRSVDVDGSFPQR